MYVLGVCMLTVNVALNKPAYEQYAVVPGGDRFDASKVVDGRKSDLTGSECAGSVYSPTAAWWVNLNRIHSIHHVTIYFVTEYIGKVKIIIMYLTNNMFTV